MWVCGIGNVGPRPVTGIAAVADDAVSGRPDSPGRCPAGAGMPGDDSHRIVRRPGRRRMVTAVTTLIAMPNVATATKVAKVGRPAWANAN
ncbi:hypothetical protein FB564_3605 [Salinispora arenicola]|uniref:Uncharacterized protein n=1 Tax=Salinispora arenicola TaxID=168697 RepID=A0A542XRB6_SALAC|nr:hypothetical protein FB564_3605 [Salinispora arenicola]